MLAHWVKYDQRNTGHEIAGRSKGRKALLSCAEETWPSTADLTRLMSRAQGAQRLAYAVECIEDTTVSISAVQARPTQLTAEFQRKSVELDSGVQSDHTAIVQHKRSTDTDEE